MLPTAISSIEGIHKHRWPMAVVWTYLDASSQLAKSLPVTGRILGIQKHPWVTMAITLDFKRFKYLQEVLKFQPFISFDCLGCMWIVDTSFLVFTETAMQTCSFRYIDFPVYECIATKKSEKMILRPKATQHQKEVDKSWLVLWPGSLADQNATLCVNCENFWKGPHVLKSRNPNENKALIPFQWHLHQSRIERTGVHHHILRRFKRCDSWWPKKCCGNTPPESLNMKPEHASLG